MSDRQLVPSIDMRLGSLLEISRRNEGIKREKGCPTITVSREFGCEAYPMAERLKEIMEQKTGNPWTLMDKELLEEVARHHKLSEDILRGLGEKTRILDEVLATFSPRWKSEKDYFRVLCKHMFSLAEKGNVILIGRGGAIVTQPLKNCFHFRMFASLPYKVASIGRRLGLSPIEAGDLVAKKQKQRDAFIRDFLDQDARELRFYHLVFNNDKNTAEQIAQLIAEYVTARFA